MNKYFEITLKFFKFVWLYTYNTIPSILLYLCFLLVLWGYFDKAIMLWIVSELIQIKNHMETAEIIVREED